VVLSAARNNDTIKEADDEARITKDESRLRLRTTTVLLRCKRKPKNKEIESKKSTSSATIIVCRSGKSYRFEDVAAKTALWEATPVADACEER
jgi:hypothetical protein